MNEDTRARDALRVLRANAEIGLRERDRAANGGLHGTSSVGVVWGRAPREVLEEILALVRWAEEGPTE